jgi:hypothetical protein
MRGGVLMKKRTCRMTEEEKAMHGRAVKLKKMTDAQLCEFIDHTYGKGKGRERQTVHGRKIELMHG